jgi:hypothetical protein
MSQEIKQRSFWGWIVRYSLIGAALGTTLMWCLGVRFGRVSLDMIVVGGPMIGVIIGVCCATIGWILNKVLG